MLKYPDAKVISLGIGDTTEHILEVITSAMAEKAYALSTLEGYSGLAEQGDKAYVDSGVIMGQTGQYEEDVERYGNIEYMRCNPENGFFPDLSKVARMDIIFFYSPNNPTGSAVTREQPTLFVEFAEKRSIIIYDFAYAMYISEDKPRPIFEIPGTKEVAIETSSFSKYAWVTGVCLGWTVIPKELHYSDGFPADKDFNCIVYTCFNGASKDLQKY